MCILRARCAVRDTAHGCEVWTQNDPAGDVFTHLERQNLLLDGPVAAPNRSAQIILVRWREGDNISAENVRGVLQSNSDFDVVEFEQLEE